MRATVVMPLLFVFVFPWYALPVYASLTRIPAPAIADPQEFPRKKVIRLFTGSTLSLEEADTFRTWIEPLMDGFPDEVLLSVSRSEKTIHIFIQDPQKDTCVIGSGTGSTFGQAAESLARNLLHNGYAIRERLISINLPRHCKPE